MNPWFWIFTIAPIIIGIKYIWTSSSRKKTKIITTLIPFSVGIIAVILFYNLVMKHKSF
jgi:uncharacterized membrane protein YesL